MARHKARRRRKFVKYLAGIINVEIDFSGLGAKAANTTIFPETVIERTYCSSIRAAWSLSNWTPTSQAGPIMVGIAHFDYSAAEIESWIENVDSWNEGNLIQQEIAKRKIRIIGIFEGGDDALDIVRLNDGKPIRTKVGWIFTTGQSLRMWVYNLGSSSVSTTTPRVHGRGVAHLWPR